MRNIFCFCLSFLFISTNAQTISLAGKWRVALHSSNANTQPISLPGTLDDAGIGEPVKLSTTLDIATLAHLQRKVQFVGKAYYTREVAVPERWKGRDIHLSLERVLWRSTVYVDGKLIPAKEESLTTSHEFDLTAHLLPGKKHELTICIDNSNIYPGINIYASQYPSKESSEMAHAYTNHTQIKWNGILGEIKLEARLKLHLKQVIITPDFGRNQITLDYLLSNSERKNVRIVSWLKKPGSSSARLVMVPETRFSDSHFIAPLTIPTVLKHWSEFNPNLYELITVLQSDEGSDTMRTSFGLRDFHVKDGNLYINSNRMFVRGNLECIIFPLKGYTPTMEKEWRELFGKAKSFGINTFRFHSWCPPESAFAAADKSGFYLQVELPHWNLKVGSDTATFRFLSDEAKRILRNYGNHPSFLFFSMGNELEGDFTKLNTLVAELKKIDRRHLYSTTTFTFQRGISGVPQPQDDYFVTQITKKGWVRGQGVFNTEYPNFSADYNASLEGINMPLISHEIGQYSVYPDISEISEYTGNLRPANFLAIKNDLQKKGLLPLAPSYLAASGQLAALLYKEEIERVLKTKDMDGFQLLQLQDFPGQGTALVGLLNAFWKSKGIITAQKFKSFCSEVTPILRFPKAVYTNDELFKADIEIANFYQPLTTPVRWNVSDEKGRVLATGLVAAQTYPVDNGLAVGKINYKLDKHLKASKLTVTVSLPGTNYVNSWNIWVYPKAVSHDAADIVVAGSLRSALAALEAGKSVLLSPDRNALKGVTGSFVPVFWSPIHFPDKAGTMGLLVNQKHKALTDFPTDSHSDWQWWDLVTKSTAVQIPSIAESAVIVRAIDNFVGNRNLANVFEAKVGKGKLIFCSMDISENLDNRPVARQLAYSLTNYMKSAAFKPEARLSEESIRQLFK